jgi:penicillin-binding protein 1C
MTLGTAGHSLLELTAAYAVLARGGDYLPARCAAGVPAPRVFVFTPGCCAMVSRMLRRRPLPMSSVDVAWKTGTSNGNRDAWCFAYTPEYTLGIWFGNKDGAPAAVLTGARAAAPAAAVVMTALYRNRPLPAWPSTEAMFRTEALCAESGLTACSRCAATRPGTVLCDVPLQACRGCRDKKAAEVMIVSPAPGNYVADPATQTVALSLRAQPADVLWYVNNRYVGELQDATRLTFEPGRHVLQAVSTGSQVKSARVTFSVGRP